MLAGVDHGHEANPVLIIGRSGLGKSEFAAAIAAIYESMGWRVIHLGCPSELLGSAFTLACDYIRNGGKVVFVIDEAHRLKTIHRVQLQRFFTFMMLHNDETYRRERRSISINDGEIGVDVTDWKRLSFVLATNFPAKLEEGKGSESFRGRHLVIALDDYSTNGIHEILAKMIRQKDLRVHESTINLIADCARGTARPLQQITNELGMMASARGGKPTLNREEVIHAIKLAKLYPNGLTATEVGILGYCEKTSQKQTVLATLFPNVESSEFRNSISWLQGRKYLKGDHGFSVTEMGIAYLNAIAKHGFPTPYRS